MKLLNRYKDTNFTIRNIEENYDEPFSIYKNFKNKLDDETILSIDIKAYDCVIYIGGSIFSETERNIKRQKNLTELAQNCKKNKIPFFYISSNFGPYKTEEYFEICKETYKNITSITFRDKYSYNLFKKIKSVNYAPDLIFGFKAPRNKTIKNSIGISVIHLNFKSRNIELKEADEVYSKQLAKKIVDFIDNNKEVYLFSFCKYEGDEVGIKKVAEQLPDNYKEKIHIVKYTGKEGNLYDFIKKYSMMEMFICTRFHSLILSMLFNQKLIVLSYNQKINNILKDIKNEYKVIEINKKLKLDKISDNDFKKINEEILSEYIAPVQKHLEELDEILESKNKQITIKGLSIFKRIKRKIKYLKNKIIKST